MYFRPCGVDDGKSIAPTVIETYNGVRSASAAADCEFALIMHGPPSGSNWVGFE